MKAMKLRVRQDAEYIESLRIDERKEKEKQDRLQKEDEERQKQEQAHVEAEQAALKRREDASSLIIEARARLPPEPPVGTDGRVRISVLLKDGRRVERAFLGSDNVGHVYD